jgi:DNA-binding NtrC family response regulator
MSAKILICSLEEGIRESFKLILGDFHDMILCDSLEQCKDVLNHSEIKTLLLDIDKQQKIIDFIKDINSKHPSAKIIAIGKPIKEGQIQEIIENGATGFVLKPIKSDQILSFCK